MSLHIADLPALEGSSGRQPMAATLVLLLAMSILLPSGADMGAEDLVFLEVDSGTSDEKLIFEDLINITKQLFVKELGTSKFSMVLKESELAKLTLKDVDEVLPVEVFDYTCEKLNLSWSPHPDISNTHLTLFKFLPSLKGQTFQQFEAELKYDIRTIGPLLTNNPHRVYISKGYMPPRGYLFINTLDDGTRVLGGIQDIFGGPKLNGVEVSYVHILHHAM
uniref:Major perivitellin subunit 4 n=1 Tax=Pomacea scalaris TaxID=527798 RepID=A0A2U8SZJ3_9CAEN|nr:major perivitellin subunit 4 [Pomacea scalaris]